MRTSIKINDKYIQKILLGSTPVQRIYQSGSIVYEAGGSSPCFEVVDTISEASGDYIDVYVKSESKWYKKNNLSQYEEYGVMPTVSDLSSITYYTGKLVILSTDNHEYKWNGSQWVDLGSAGTFKNYIFIDPAESSSQNVQYTFKYYFGNDFKMKLLFYLTPNYSYYSDFSVIGYSQNSATGYGTAPLEFSFYSNGFYFDSHYPISGYNGNAYNAGDFNNRVMQQSVLNNHKGKMLIAEIRFNKVTIYDFESGAVIGTYGSNYTSSTWGTELSANNLIIEALVRLNYGNSKNPAHLGYIQVYDKNDNLVNDIRFVPDENQKIYMHDSIEDQDYTSPSTLSFNYHTEAIGELDPPVDYDTKVAPADNVHYNTLAELEMMECPWIGMVATIGEDYTVYVYTEDGWVIGDVPLDLPYLRFTALENTTFTFTKSNLAAADLEIKYSIDGKPWNTMESGVATPTVPAGSYVVFKSNFKGGSGDSWGYNNNGNFSSTGNFSLSGNIMSLIHGDEFVGKTSLANYTNVFSNLFYNCTKLKSISEGLLPATTLANQCYSYMFQVCTGLTSLPAGLLPATTLAEKCYNNMFIHCKGITSIPSGLLPATTLANQCYANMFYGTGITSVPSGFLPATNLANSCYSYMFAYSNVNSIPADLLPATTLANSCYYGLFSNSKITSVPAGLLPATTLANQCYANMFSECKSLKSAYIELPATTFNNAWVYSRMFFNCTNLVEPPTIKSTSVSGNDAFYQMFYGCAKMNYLICDMLNEPSSSISSDWLNGVAATGTFYKNPNATWDQTITPGTSTVPSGWTITTLSEPEYLKFTTVDDNGSTYAFSKAGLEYSIDGGAWTTLAANTNTPNVPKDSNIRFRGYLTPSGSQGIGTFTSSGKFDAEGDLMTLLYGEYYVGQTGKFANSMFKELFMNSNVVDAANIILPNVSYNYLYQNTFRNCVYLTSSPAMPAASCTWRMYSDTYNGCTSLVNVGKISAYNTCSIEGACGMFKNCTSLVSSPVIIMNAQMSAFYQLFDGCSNLSEVTYLGTTSPSSTNSSYWLRNVAATGTFYMNQNATWDQTVPRNADGVPAGWTIVKVDPNDY